MRRALLACLTLAALASAAAAQDASWLVGTWRDLPIERAAGQRVVLHHVEIAPRPTLRAPQQFNVHLWARCADNPDAACDLGVVTGVARALSDGSAGIFVAGSPRNGDALLPCRFNLLFVSAYIAGDPANPESRKRGVDYRITPPSGPCRVTQYHATIETVGSLDRMAALRRDAPPVEPSLPRP